MTNYLKDNKELMLEWNYEKNSILGIVPDEITMGQNKKVWWKCAKGHEWQASVNNRSKGKRCPYCSNRLVLKGYNDLATTHPELTKEWNYEKNGKITPNTIMYGSHKKVWWKCNKGHEWQAKIYNRTCSKNGCPYCSNQKFLKGYNDLETMHPELLEEWNYEKNNELKPSMIMGNSTKKVWWTCPNGHEYMRAINRKKKDKGCPICSKELQTSFPEKVIYFYLKKFYPNIICNYRDKTIKDKEIDIYIPELKVGIEYDGEYYHKDINEDIVKDNICKDNGILLIRVREKRAIRYESSSLKFCLEKNNNFNELERVIAEIFAKLNIVNCTPNITRDLDDIYELMNLLYKEKSIVSTNPELLEEWDYEKNGKFKPNMFLRGSKHRAWWKCGKGHEWRASILSRACAGLGCPFCSGKRVLRGFNDLRTTHPKLADEWNYEKNGDLTPDMISKGSEKEVWWKCSKGHEWKTRIQKRACSGHGCPYCTNQLVIKGENDLETIKPDFIEEWNYEKNGNLKPDMISKGSNKKVWWKCSKGHEWLASTYDRFKGNGCPYCSNHRLLKGYNDLATTHPELAKEWNYEKNGKITPDSVFGISGKKVWWKCRNGHEWQAYISNRSRGNNCPYCVENNIVKGNPELLKEWNYEKNQTIKPDMISVKSQKKVWWKCAKGHEWQARIDSRNGGAKCPYCVNRKILKGYNDLATTNPEVASEWNYKRNGDLTPYMFSKGSEKKVWWKCSKGHEWQARISHRTGDKTKCPYCSGRKKI